MVSVTDSQTREQRNSYCSAWSALTQASCYSYPSQWWCTAKQGWKAPTHFVYLGILKILFLQCGGAPLLHIFKPDHILQECVKKNLKTFCNSLAVRVEELPLSHQESIHQLPPLHLFPTALLQALQKSFFSLPHYLSSQHQTGAQHPTLLLPYWWRKLETAWSSNRKLNLETKFTQPSLTIPQITLKNAQHFCGL